MQKGMSAALHYTDNDVATAETESTHLKLFVILQMFGMLSAQRLQSMRVDQAARSRDGHLMGTDGMLAMRSLPGISRSDCGGQGMCNKLCL